MARRKKPSGNSIKKPRSIDRKKGNRQPRKTILIVCEGQETEPKYFESLRQAQKLGTVTVVGGKGKTSASQIVERSLRRKALREQEARRSTKRTKYDEVWCVLDRENIHKNESFERAVIDAKKNNIRLAVSNPAFEYWYLLHFKDTTSPFGNAAALIKQLNKYIPEYDKSAHIFAQIESNTEIAIERSKRVLKNRPDQKDLYPNPSTRVHELVDQLID